jgi:biopolymer transport protein ExbD
MPSQKPSDRRRGGLDDQLPEPDLTPIMNLTFMLILALLTMAAIMPMGLISVQAPQINNGGGGGGPPPEEQKKPLNLTIFVTKKGYNIAASGATLTGDNDDPARPGQALFPILEENGERNYDFGKLTQRLSIIKKSFPLEQSVIITADEDVKYEDIVKTMDAAREDPDGNELFPGVAFSAGIVG